MNPLERKGLIEFLQRVDRKLAKRTKALIIGGSAIALVYSPRYGTVDIDTIETDRDFFVACDKVNQETGSKVIVSPVTVADTPYNYEDRLQAVPIPGAKHLEVMVPEKHDLAMMKTLRGIGRDLEGVEAIHEASPLSAEKLIGLYTNEMSHAIGDKRTFRLNFLAAYARLFGEAEARKIEPTLPVLGEKRK
ncbi:MAG: hypothetical protein A3G34_01855 [Candidatus Lindowbacteria bacterium RIFCSPLOWO2_12_FULL_62_27]|nr:MAG: hypothetical protein A3I06_05800 [Candidatus Lindowbacteria bacterium RIFCSPLOWO2_02_FULL_62_12]OGH59053.1 MAG: hypothetical protein A3G34_01855 [Candidatus Lindowbacteria bacterium RIFCSPLOWO2_12_FULL_62_27]